MNVCRDPDELSRLIEANAPEGFLNGETAATWLADPRHFALVEGDDLSMFEAQGEWPCELIGHVLFKGRGREALETAREMLCAAFAYGATAIMGEIPASFHHCLLFVRLLGFRPYDERECESGKFVLVRLSRPPSDAEEHDMT